MLAVPHAHQAKKTDQPQNDKISFFCYKENPKYPSWGRYKLLA